MSSYSSGSSVKCRKPAFCRRRGAGDISRVLRPGGNAKQRLNAGDGGALIEQVLVSLLFFAIRKAIPDNHTVGIFQRGKFNILSFLT